MKAHTACSYSISTSRFVLFTTRCLKILTIPHGWVSTTRIVIVDVTFFSAAPRRAGRRDGYLLLQEMRFLFDQASVFETARGTVKHMKGDATREH